MKREIVYEIRSLYRDAFRVTGYSFGEGEEALCIIGAMRGNENQQLYCCSRLIEHLKRLEEKGRLTPGKKIMVIPCVNTYSMNVKKRFWSVDNTDINRMFPGYDKGETTQRIAAGVFDVIKSYEYGIQFASFYMPGSFVPHVRLMHTGFEDVEAARDFGMPYVVVQTPRPFDTTTLNYNWQIWETKAFSLYSTNTARLDQDSARAAEESVLTFMARRGLLRYQANGGYISRVVRSDDFINLRAGNSGFFEGMVKPGEHVESGRLLARIRDTYTGEVLSEVVAPAYGVVAFVCDEPMTYANTAVVKLIREEDE